jgi:hypothetical protein
MITHFLGLVLALSAVSPPCTDKPCAVTFDWGAGKNAGDFPTDLRYGPAVDLESAVRRVLTSHGARLSDREAALIITLRPIMDSRAMCDETAGTGTAYDCQAVSEVTIRFSSGDPTIVAPPLFRITNRCGGATKLYARTRQFGDYVGEMIWWTLFGKDGKQKKPSVPC